MPPSTPGTAAARWWTPKAGWSASARLIYSQSGGNEGIGFAAPSNIVRNVFEQIRKTGRVRRGEIGVATQTVTATLAEALKLGGGCRGHRRRCGRGQPRGQSGPAARRRDPRARRQADGERPPVPHQHLHADHRPGGDARRAARRAPADGAGPGVRAREHDHQTQRSADTPEQHPRAGRGGARPHATNQTGPAGPSPQPRGRRRHRVRRRPVLATGTVAGWGRDLSARTASRSGRSPLSKPRSTG